MLTVLTFFGSVALAAFSFLLGRFYAESERILSEKRKLYSEFLNVLPALQRVYDDTNEQEFDELLRPTMERIPGLLFYADKSVIMAFNAMLQNYHTANVNLSTRSPPLAAEYKALAKAQNDLILEMRRDSFRFSIFNFRGASRVFAPEDL